MPNFTLHFKYCLPSKTRERKCVFLWVFLVLLRRTSFWPPSMVYISVIIYTNCYEVIQLFRVTCFIAGQYNTDCYGTNTGVLSISTICQSAEYILELYILIQIRTIQLLIFTEKFSSLPGFEPGTSLVSSRYATNWAILAWIGLTILIPDSSIQLLFLRKLSRFDSTVFRSCK